MTIEQLIEENSRRNGVKYAPFNPLTGQGDTELERVALHIIDYAIPTQYIPVAMLQNPLIVKLKLCGSVEKFANKYLGAYNNDIHERIVRKLIRVRIHYDFFFWAFVFVPIKSKMGGEDIPFKLNRPQRRLIACFEKQRQENKPIRLILLKARQWGGSTAVQIYMGWIQLVHKTAWNSLVVAHVRDASLEVKGMFSKLIDSYPTWLLHDDTDDFDSNEKKITSFEGALNIDIVPARRCKIKVGTAERPDSARGGDSAMVHCTEVAFWNKTDNKTPEQIVRSACSGVPYVPLSMKVYESTANGTGNYFHKEWGRAKIGKSDKEPLFIPWFDIEMYSLPIEDIPRFAKELLINKDNTATDGQYNWWLWNKGATLEAISWYMANRKDYDDHADMAAEYPSDDVEAFKHSGAKVFNQYKVEELRSKCKRHRFMGDVYGDSTTGRGALQGLQFTEDRQGSLKVWELPETDIMVTDRYLTVVDIGGRSKGADFSDILVLDRYWLMDGDKPSVVAEWHGHIDHDLLAWKAAQIAAFYCNSLLVIESNTLETKDRDRDTDGNHTSYILNLIGDVYPNLYARRQSEDEIKGGAPRKWGFHTNTATKPMVIDHLVKMIREQAYIERNEDYIHELLCYEKRQNGSFGAIPGEHDDMLMTRAIGLFICFCEMPLPRIIEPTIKYKSKRSLTAATI